MIISTKALTSYAPLTEKQLCVRPRDVASVCCPHASHKQKTVHSIAARTPRTKTKWCFQVLPSRLEQKENGASECCPHALNKQINWCRAPDSGAGAQDEPRAPSGREAAAAAAGRAADLQRLLPRQLRHLLPSLSPAGARDFFSQIFLFWPSRELFQTFLPLFMRVRLAAS